MNNVQVINLFVEWSKRLDIRGRGFDVKISKNFKEFRIRVKDDGATE